jgi:ribosomal protein S18 acetylase RimI-like enzyme
MLPHDAPKVAEVQIVSWQKAYSSILPEAYLTSMDAKKRSFTWKQGLELNPDVVRLVLVKNNLVVGLACGLENRFPELLNEVESELWAIYLDPDVWFRGLGSRLIVAFKDEMKKLGFKKMSVWVLKDNVLAQNFYLKHNGKKSDVEKSVNYGGKSLKEISFIFDL